MCPTICLLRSCMPASVFTQASVEQAQEINDKLTVVNEELKAQMRAQVGGGGECAGKV